jgi:hypothetical protein
MIRCSTSIKVITNSKEINAHRKTTTATEDGVKSIQTMMNNKAVRSSTPKYWNAMGAWHFLHFPISHSQLISGKLSQSGIADLQFGQKERSGALTDIPSGNR